MALLMPLAEKVTRTCAGCRTYGPVAWVRMGPPVDLFCDACHGTLDVEDALRGEKGDHGDDDHD